MPGVMSFLEALETLGGKPGVMSFLEVTRVVDFLIATFLDDFTPI